MKIFISVDIEGIAGIVHWDEATRWKPDYPPFCDELMNEIKAACEGANQAGTKEILINDGHGVGRNLNFSNLPDNVKIIRSYNGHPFCMMQEIDNSFDAVLMIGYHSYGSSDQNPLSHTLDDNIAYIKINGEYASIVSFSLYCENFLQVYEHESEFAPPEGSGIFYIAVDVVWRNDANEQSLMETAGIRYVFKIVVE